MDDKLAQLMEIGFKRIGQWRIVDRGLAYELEDLGKYGNVLYAFAVNDELMYIGKTAQPLHMRLIGYRNPGKTQVTNIKINCNILNCLNGDKKVDVYMLRDSGMLHFGRFHLNSAAGLEDSLIRELQPSWNGSPKKWAGQSVRSAPVPPTVLAKTQPKNEAVRPRIVTAFREELHAMFAKAVESKSHSLEVNAGDLHRSLGGYPGPDHRMPICCQAMRSAMNDSDVVVRQPPKGAGASLTIRYTIPRK